MKNPFVYGLLLGGIGSNGAWILSTPEFPIPARVAGGLMVGLALLICFACNHD